MTTARNTTAIFNQQFAYFLPSSNARRAHFKNRSASNNSFRFVFGNHIFDSVVTDGANTFSVTASKFVFFRQYRIIWISRLSYDISNLCSMLPYKIHYRHLGRHFRTRQKHNGIAWTNSNWKYKFEAIFTWVKICDAILRMTWDEFQYILYNFSDISFCLYSMWIVVASFWYAAMATTKSVKMHVVNKNRLNYIFVT